jgi:molybdate transport system ATP-binding protein
MTISVEIRERLGDFELDARFVSAGRLTALFGPSGSGKSSVINFIAGLIKASDGRVTVDGRVLFDTGKRINVPRHKRRIGYVFQEARLFPHMNVRQNLAYGRWFAPAEDRSVDSMGVIDLLGLGQILDRMPNLLSGGEKQRVAIGRALLSGPKLLLMDEPLASLDQARKSEIMPYIERLRDETKVPIIYVSHSVAEVARLATDIIVMSHGKVIASGTTEEIMQQSDLMPVEEQGEAGSMLEMVVVSFDDKFGITLLRSAVGEIRVPGRFAAIGKTIRLRVRSRDVLIANQRPEGLSALNVLEGKIAGINRHGPLVDVKIDCAGTAITSRITYQSSESLKLAVGMPMFAIVKTASIDAGNNARGMTSSRGDGRPT